MIKWESLMDVLDRAGLLDDASPTQAEHTPDGQFLQISCWHVMKWESLMDVLDRAGLLNGPPPTLEELARLSPQKHPANSEQQTGDAVLPHREHHFQKVD
jgi:hypothetical protein